MIAKQTKRIIPAERVSRRTETINEQLVSPDNRGFQDQVKKHTQELAKIKQKQVANLLMQPTLNSKLRLKSAAPNKTTANSFLGHSHSLNLLYSSNHVPILKRGSIQTIKEEIQSN